MTGLQYKDCVTTCTSDNCNANNEEVFRLASELDSNGNPRDISCFSCNSDFDKEGDVAGMPNCYNTPQGQPDGKICPIYANAGCFKSKTIIDDGEGGGFYYKGCSTFKVKDELEENEAECSRHTTTDAGQEYQLFMCDSVCSGSKGEPCNGGTAQGAGRMCYTCETAVNHEGQMVGWGDLACLENPNDYQLEFCADDQDICVTEFSAEWRLAGMQVYTMRRGCSKSNGISDGCLVANGNNYMIKGS